MSADRYETRAFRRLRAERDGLLRYKFMPGAAPWTPEQERALRRVNRLWELHDRYRSDATIRERTRKGWLEHCTRAIRWTPTGARPSPEWSLLR